MNLFIIILIGFSLLGFIDLVFDLHLGLKDEFNQGLATIGSLSLSMLGILTVGVVFIQNHIDTLTKLTNSFAFDPSLIFGVLLAPDMGGYSIAANLSMDHSLLLFHGVLLSSLLGQTISFQIPVFVGAINQRDHSLLFQSFIIGIIVIPIGLLAGGFMIGIDFKILMMNWIPILIICGMIAVLMKLSTRIMIQLFSSFAAIIQYITYLLFLIAVAGFLFPAIAYVPNELLADTMLTLLKIGIIVAGSLVLSKLILKYLSKPIQKFAKVLGINEVAMIGLILSFASSLAMLPLFNKMDKKGKLVNGAFSVSGAYLLGGQLAYISSNETGKIITIYIFTKLLCGLLSILLIHFMEKRIESL